MAVPPAAFLSYVRFDDQHEEGRITDLRKRLEGEIRIHTGLRDFTIFQDRDLRWGEQWQARIDQTIDAATFFIPILTPLFFRSDPCRDELTKFLEREKALRRGDLILPIYYVDAPTLNDPAKRARDLLAAVIAARQYADWREFRHEPWTDPRIGRMLGRMAVQVRDALELSESTAGAKPEKSAATGTPAAGSDQPVAESRSVVQSPTQKPSLGPSPKIEPPTRIVDPFHRGDFVTISAAISAANPGDRILIRPGLYVEGLTIEKPLEILGDGSVEDIVIRASKKAVILFRASMGRILNLTLQQAGGDWYAVDITLGRLELEGCDITSLGNACVAIHGAADPRLRRNQIHDAKTAGVFVYEGGHGTLEDNEIFGNFMSGVDISEANPTLRRNRIHDGKTVGVMVRDGGQGTLEDNEIFGNASGGVDIRTGANPTLRRNRIHDCKQSGVFVHDLGRGTLEDNEIFANATAGLWSVRDANPLVRGNRIFNNSYRAIVIREGGGGTFEDNDLRGNALGAWDIAKDCESKATRKNNQE